MKEYPKLPKKTVEEWLKFADENFKVAGHELEYESPACHTVCFLCQGSAEKYLKAYLISKGWELKKTYDIVELLEYCSDYDENFDQLIGDGRILNALFKTNIVLQEHVVNVLRIIDKFSRDGIEQTKKELKKEEVDSSLVDKVIELIQCKTLKEAESIMKSAGADITGIEELQMVINNSIALGIPESRIVPDFSIARGLDYYLKRQINMVALAQMVRTSDCGSGGCGFKARMPPHKKEFLNAIAERWVIRPNYYPQV